jgi:hypothetical protein
VPPEQPVASPSGYLAASASRSLFLVRASEVLARRVPAMAGEAERLAAQHRGVAAQLNLAGRRLDLLPPASLLPHHQSWLAEVEQAGDPAAAWRQRVGAALAECERQESDYSLRGTSPTLRPVARFALGVCREELARRR